MPRFVKGDTTLGRHGKHARGERHPKWKGGRFITSSGYVAVMVSPDHPHGWGANWIDGEKLSPSEMGALAWADGFRATAKPPRTTYQLARCRWAMQGFWLDVHGPAVFEGVIIHWNYKEVVEWPQAKRLRATWGRSSRR